MVKRNTEMMRKITKKGRREKGKVRKVKLREQERNERRNPNCVWKL